MQAMEATLKEKEEDEDEGEEDEGDQELTVEEEIKISRRYFHRTLLDRMHLRNIQLLKGTETFLC